MTEVPGPELLDAALSCAARGWPVLPCAGKIPHKETGLFEHGVSEARTSPFWVKRLWARWPTANVACAAGEAAGWWALDADLKAEAGEDGFATLSQLEGLFGEPLPETLGQLTPSGGRHWLFRWPGKPVSNSSRKRLGPGLDTRGDGGYILVAPSIHPTAGRRYEWIGDPDKEGAIAPAPEWLLRLLSNEPADLEWVAQKLAGKSLPEWLIKRLEKALPPSDSGEKPPPAPTGGVHPYARAALEDECKRVADARPGTQNDTLNEAAFKIGTLVGGGHLPESTAYQRLLAAGLTMSHDPKRGRWSPAQLERTIRGGIDAGRKHPRDLPPPEPQGKGRPSGPRPAGRGYSAPPPADPAADAQAVMAARALWRGRSLIQAGGPAARYLAGLGVERPEDWPMLAAGEMERLHSADGAPPQVVGAGPVLLAVMSVWDGGPPRAAAVFALWLDRDGTPSAFRCPWTGKRVPPWQCLGAPLGAAIRLGPVTALTERLVLAADFALGLGAQLARPSTPVWVVPSVRAMARVALPATLREVTLIGVDGALPAYRDAAVRHAAQDGRTVRISWTRPPPAEAEQRAGGLVA